MKGKVDTYFPSRGFGFLSSTESGKRQSHFFHVSQVITGEPVQDAEAEFDIGAPDKSGKTAPAINVRIGGAQ